MRDLPRVPSEKIIRGSDLNRVIDTVNKNSTFKVAGTLEYRRTPGGHALLGRPSGQGRGEMWAILTGQIPLTHRDAYGYIRQRWIYQWYEVYRCEVNGVGRWERLPGGLGTDEDGGEMPGAQNSVDWGWIGDPAQPKDIYISPVAVGTVVRLSVIETVDGWTECWFECSTDHDTQAPSDAVETKTLYDMSDNWSIYQGEGSVDKGECVRFRIVEDVVYNDEDYNCKAYKRWVTIDPTGRIVKISGAEAETVFVAVECP